MTDGSVLWLVVVVLWFLKKIRPTQLWVELSWVVAIMSTFIYLQENIWNSEQNCIFWDILVCNDLVRFVFLFQAVWAKSTSFLDTTIVLANRVTELQPSSSNSSACADGTKSYPGDCTAEARGPLDDRGEGGEEQDGVDKCWDHRWRHLSEISIDWIRMLIQWEWLLVLMLTL